LSKNKSFFENNFIDSDGKIEHLLPVCLDKICKKSSIFIRKNSVWIDVNVDFGAYGFLPSRSLDEFWDSKSVSVIAGDYNLNGYLDLMAVMRLKNSTKGSQSETYAVLIQNVGATKVVSDSSEQFSRAFRVDTHITSLFSHQNVVQASFFDLFDNVR
jgi:hypothetical protein